MTVLIRNRFTGGWGGTYGVHINGIDKLAHAGRDAQFSTLGISLIEELVDTISVYGYERSIERWHEQAVQLRIIESDPLCPNSLRHILSIGQARGKRDFILNSLWCRWGYILNLDDEVFEVYQGDQKQPHDRGRFAGLRCPIEGMTYYPCALITSISLVALPALNFDSYWVDDSE